MAVLTNIYLNSETDRIAREHGKRVLVLLFGQPTRSLYANELIGLAGMGSGAVQGELTTLADSAIVTVRSVGNQKALSGQCRRAHLRGTEGHLPGLVRRLAARGGFSEGR